MNLKDLAKLPAWGLIFSGPMIAPILEDRKTMTRRLDKRLLSVKKGKLLYVKETWIQPFKRTEKHPGVIYRADGPEYNSLASQKHQWGAGHAWKSSMFMPRWAARTYLEATVDARLEWLQDISEEDAKKEGVSLLFSDEEIRKRPELGVGDRSYKNYLWHGDYGQFGMGNKKSWTWKYQFSGYKDARGSFSSLWEMINGPGSWESNPEVVILAFKRVKED